MTYETIILEQREGIARVTLNRPDRLNSFTRQMHAELAQALDEAASARVIVRPSSSAAPSANRPCGELTAISRPTKSACICSAIR